MSKRNIKIVKCLICANEFPSVGLDSHLKYKHNITSKDYKAKYIIIDKSNFKFNCLICDNKFKTERLFSYHLNKEHNIKDKLIYINEYIFNNEKQLCLCGCKKEVKILKQYPYKSDYISGHNENGMKGKLHQSNSKDIMRIKAVNRLVNKDNTDIELKFKDLLERNNINYIHQYKLNDVGVIDFYLIDYNVYIEIDGSYWHPDNISGLNLQQLSNIVNDIKKNLYFKNNNLKLIRIRDYKLKDVNTIYDILNIKDKEINIGYYDKIITKEYIENYINRKGEDKFKTMLYLFIKFLRLYIDEYPYPNFPLDINLIKSKLNTNHKVKDKIFKNNISNIGVKELKSIFKNYWKSNYNNNKSPYEIFNNDYELKKILINRLILMKNDFSLATVNRGMGVLRYSISFFKPQVAYNIYKHFLKDNNSPTVIDPCAGFGGRLIGFVLAYPNGRYIGIEPNVETFNYLKHIKDNYLSNYNIELYNITQEEYISNNLNIKSDLTFTSIPYYNKEDYNGNNLNYNDITNWENKFVTNIIKYPNLLLNIPMELEYLFPNFKDKYYLQNNVSNFNKNLIKNELLIYF